MKSLEERMIEYRAKENISQAELAKRCNVTVQTINAVENCIQKPSNVTRMKIELVIKKEED